MRIAEVHIEVTDLEKSRELYQNLLNLKYSGRFSDGMAYSFILPGGDAFGIWKKGKLGLYNGQAGKNVHLAFQIKPDEYDDMLNKIISFGLKPIKHNWENDHRSIYFFDYDNHQIEFITCDWHEFKKD